jgi:tRNA 5-methylaminomethyl-2-thiouridine biosynthesis bifunctional protein
MPHFERSFDVVIVGAGLAGASCAFALAQKGAKIALLDSQGEMSSRGSGNALGLITPYLSLKSSPLEAFYSAGYRFTQNFLTRFRDAATTFRRSGALQLPSTSRLKNLIESASHILGAEHASRVDSDKASELAQIPIRYKAIFVKDGGFISPRDFCLSVTNYHSAEIDIILNSECVEIRRVTKHWEVLTRDGLKITAPNVIISAASESAKFQQSAWVPLEPVRGQTVLIEKASSLNCVVSYGGYITPCVNQRHFIGAHYSHDDSEPNPRDTDTASVVDLCAKWLPELGLSRQQIATPRVCFRASTIDRLPYIGALPDFNLMTERSSQYRSGTDLKSKIELEFIPGLFINAGHGSRGLISCPMAGEILARTIAGEPFRELAAAALASCPSRLPWGIIRDTRP